MGQIKNFLHKNQASDDRYVRIKLEGESVFQKLFTIVIILGCVSAQANTGGDCYPNCPGNPNTSYSSQSAFDQNNDQTVALLAQAFAALGNQTSVELPSFGTSTVGNGSGRLGDRTKGRQQLEELQNDGSDVDK
jgi:hypothetical protein